MCVCLSYDFVLNVLYNVVTNCTLYCVWVFCNVVAKVYIVLYIPVYTHISDIIVEWHIDRDTHGTNGGEIPHNVMMRVECLWQTYHAYHTGVVIYRHSHITLCVCILANWNFLQCGNLFSLKESSGKDASHLKAFPGLLWCALPIMLKIDWKLKEEFPSNETRSLWSTP